MSSTPAEDTDPGGRAALLEALEVSRNARLGLVVGAAVAVLVTGFFLGVVAGGDPGEPTPYYLGLAFVVFVSTALLAASALTARRALALAVHPASVVRRAATVGLLGGLCWLGAAAALAVAATEAGGLEAAGAGRTVAGYLLPWAPLLTLGGVWAVHTRTKRETPVRPLGALGALLAVPGAVVVADLAALELSVLVADAVPPGSRVRAVFVGGAALLVAGHALQATAAALAGRSRLAVLLAAGPLAGLAGLVALGPGAASLAAIAAGCAVAWLGVPRSLRTVADEAVPASPAAVGDTDPDAESVDSAR